MITLRSIRELVASADYAALGALAMRAKTEKIEGCDDRATATIQLALFETAVLAAHDAGRVRMLLAMLNAAERGVSPYDDAVCRALMAADIAAARGQVKPRTRKR